MPLPSLKKRTKRPTCKKASAFPCGYSCQPRMKNGKDVVCGKSVTGQPKTFLDWAKSQSDRVGKINQRQSKMGSRFAYLDGDNPNAIKLAPASRVKIEPKPDKPKRGRPKKSKEVAPAKTKRRSPKKQSPKDNLSKINKDLGAKADQELDCLFG